MKTILLLRHAKSDWSADYSTDALRPLSKRGRKAANLIGCHLADLGLEPDEILSSPALRAHDTARRVAEAAGWQCPVEVDSRIYESSVELMLEVCRGRGESIAILMLVGHQPIWSSLAGALVGGDTFEIPTATVLRIDAQISSWADLRRGSGKLQWLVTPRQLKPDTGA